MTLWCYVSQHESGGRVGRGVLLLRWLAAFLLHLCTSKEGAWQGGEGCDIGVACCFSDCELIFSLLEFNLGYK